MIDLHTTRDDELYRIFHCLELVGDEPYFNHIINKFQTVLPCSHNIYSYHCFSRNHLKILLANTIYAFRNSGKKIIVLRDNARPIDDYYFIFNLNKYYKIFFPSEIDDILMYDFDIMMTDVNNLSYNLNYFPLPDKSQYIVLYEMSNPHVFTEQSYSMFQYLKHKPHLFQFFLYGPCISNAYIQIADPKNIMKIDTCNYEKKNEFLVVYKFQSPHLKFIHLIETKNIESSILLVDPEQKNDITKILSYNDICYSDLDEINIFNYSDFIVNIARSKSYRFHVLSNQQILTNLLIYFDNLFIFNTHICINKLRELVYYEENKKTIYFLHDNEQMFNNICEIYNNPVKRI